MGPLCPMGEGVMATEVGRGGVMTPFLPGYLGELLLAALSGQAPLVPLTLLQWETIRQKRYIFISRYRLILLIKT